MDLERFNATPEAKRTVWLEDPAVDVAASDVREWFDTGEGYQLLAKQEPSWIRWRPLGPDEGMEAALMSGAIKDADFASDEDRVMWLARHYRNSARFGLVEFTGLEFRHCYINGVRCLDDSTMLKLSRIKMKAPSIYEGRGELRFLTWIGGLISRSSFRDDE